MPDSMPTDAEVETYIESLDGVPNQPAYADRALNKLAAEVRRSRAAEKRLREVVEVVKDAVEGVES